jgi:hypothetical protein
MPIGWKLLGLIIVLVFWTTGCTVICSSCPGSDKGIVASNNESQGPTVEVRGRSREASFIPKSVYAHVTLGNVFVNVVEPEDANHVLILAQNVMLTDNLAEAQFISDTVDFDRDGREFVEIAPGPGAPALDTHLYVHRAAPLDIIADRGNIQINGHTGPVTAQAGGSIEVRGATLGLNLTAHSGITVDGAHNQLTLHTENGPIEITAEDVNIDASTGAGDILFVGRLISGASYFTTTSGSNITVMLPRNGTYAITANTTGNTIDVQFPAMADNLGNPVCGTFNSGPPYVIRADDRDHRTRGQVTLNKGDVRAAGPAYLIGLVTPHYFAFHSTARNVLLEAPRVSEFFIETLFDDPLSAPTAGASQPATPTIQAPRDLTQSEQAALDSFMNAADQPSSGQTQSNPLPPTGGVPMYSVHCPIPISERSSAPVAVIATSNGGHIRIYQNLP